MSVSQKKWETDMFFYLFCVPLQIEIELSCESSAK